MPLTDAKIRNAVPSEKAFKLSDGGGLHVLVTPHGSKLWRLKYRLNGREKLLSIGSYPVVGLKAARAARDGAKETIAAGLDPSEEKRRSKQRAAEDATNTFAAVAEEFVGKLEREGRAPVTVDKARWLLGMANATLGNRPIAEISAREVLAAIKPIEAAGKYETARRMRATMSRVFRLAVATDRADSDPTSALQGALIRPNPTPRAAITDLVGLRTLYRAIDAYGGQLTTRSALKLLALLAQRPGEVRQARWDEFDADARVWTIPADRMKMRRPHRVPLSGPALDILAALKPVTGWADYVFPSIRSPRRPLSENTLNVALRTMGYDQTQMTSHGFRAGFSTIANESGLWHPDAIERCLAHVEGNAVRRAYARGEHWDERVRLVDWWAEQLVRDDLGST